VNTIAANTIKAAAAGKFLELNLPVIASTTQKQAIGMPPIRILAKANVLNRDE
jgi:hypothetical protein